MLRVAKWLISLVLIIAVVVIGGGYLLPADIMVKRGIEIAAPPEKVFAIVGDLKRFGEFSPWADLDPAMTVTFEGPDGAVGQTMKWVSAKSDVGSGTMTITELIENRRVVNALDFGDMGRSVAAFDLAPAAAGTAVTWDLRTTLNSPLERWFGLMFDRWIGADYDKGLAKLKALAERR